MSETNPERYLAASEEQVKELQNEVADLNRKIEESETLLTAYTEQGAVDAADEVKKTLLGLERIKASLQQAINERKTNEITFQYLKNRNAEILFKGKNESFEA